jgi:rubrerythrin
MEGGHYMINESNTTLGALRTAIRMEIDGKEFYLKSSQTSANDMGKKLFKTLAGEEDIHRRDFEKIFKDISTNKGWTVIKISKNGGSKLRTVFSEATEDMAKQMKALPTEIDAIQTAMDMENKTYDFYKNRSGLAAYAGEKEFYEQVAIQEKEHHRVLLDYFEFLKNPAAWFVVKERQSVDGG